MNFLCQMSTDVKSFLMFTCQRLFDHIYIVFTHNDYRNIFFKFYKRKKNRMLEAIFHSFKYPLKFAHKGTKELKRTIKYLI